MIFELKYLVGKLEFELVRLRYPLFSFFLYVTFVEKGNVKCLCISISKNDLSIVSGIFSSKRRLAEVG